VLAAAAQIYDVHPCSKIVLSCDCQLTLYTNCMCFAKFYLLWCISHISIYICTTVSSTSM